MRRGAAPGIPDPDALEMIIRAAYAGVAAIILTFAARARSRLLALESPEQERRMLFLACFAYAVIVPRFKVYSYILLLAPAFHLLRTSRALRRSGDVLGRATDPIVDLVIQRRSSTAFERVERTEFFDVYRKRGR